MPHHRSICAAPGAGVGALGRGDWVDVLSAQLVSGAIGSQELLICV